MNLMYKQKGFSLIELAIVLIIMGFVIGSLLLPLKAQRDSSSLAQTEMTLEMAKKALLGFAQATGRLPCPATNDGTGTFPDGTGTSNPNGSGACVHQVGFLPAATLGIQPTDAQGFALDAWGGRIRYAVTNANTNAFTTSAKMSEVGITVLQPDLRVCHSSMGITATVCSTGTESNYSINNAVAVIYSTGITGSLASGGNDENANLDNDMVFVSHDVTVTSATGGEFDHMVTWISPYVLYNAMIEAGQLH